MNSEEHKFYINETEYSVQLVHSDYEGALNQIYAFVFHCKEKGNNKLKAIRIEVLDQVIDMWTRVGGNKEIQEDKDIFAWQLVPYFLPKLSLKDTIRIFIHSTDNISKQEDIVYIKASDTISGTARKIIFSGERPSNNLIRREILKICFNNWQNDPHGFVTRTELLKFIPVNDTELERNLDYLKQTYYIEGSLTSGGYMHVKITTRGIDIFENPIEFERKFALRLEQQTTYNINGDMITTVLVGNDNKTNIKSTEAENKKE